MTDIRLIYAMVESYIEDEDFLGVTRFLSRELKGRFEEYSIVHLLNFWTFVMTYP